MLRWLTAGESHGPALVATIDGLPAGVEVTTADVAAALARRRLGYGRGARMKFEQDEVEFLGGVRHGLTLGSPIAIRVGNSEWPKWQTVMSPDPVDADGARRGRRRQRREGDRPQPAAHPAAPGPRRPRRHAEVRLRGRAAGARAGLGPRDRGPGGARRGGGARSSSRPTASGWCRTPWRSAGRSVSDDAPLPTADDVEALDADPVRAFDAEGSAAMVAEIEAAHKDGDTLGGVVEVVVTGLPPGLGSHVHWDRRLDARLAGALMGIQAIKGVEVGDGFRTAARRGSVAHDEMERGADGVIRRRTGRAGGTEGGMSVGGLLRVRAAMKPISTVPRALETVDVASDEPARAIHQRSDVCAVPAAGVVAEAMVALVLAEACLEKFGGDSVGETARNHASYLAAIPASMRTWED